MILLFDFDERLGQICSNIRERLFCNSAKKANPRKLSGKKTVKKNSGKRLNLTDGVKLSGTNTDGENWYL
jgi:hypothetical protein